MKTQDETAEPLQEQRITRAIKKYTERKIGKSYSMTKAQKKRRRTHNRDTGHKGSTQDRKMEPETNDASPTRKTLLPYQAW